MAIPYRQEVLRKMVHLSSLWMPFSLFYLPRLFNVIMFGTFAVLNVLIEIAVFRQVPYVTPLYKALFGKMAGRVNRASSGSAERRRCMRRPA